MSFEESALKRLRRYREEAEVSLEVRRSIEETTRRFSEQLFGGLEYAAALGRRSGFGMEVERAREVLVLRVETAPGTGARLTLGLVVGTAAETDEGLMHEELSRYNLDPSGYSGRILGWSEEAGEEPCQIFAVYRDGVWKTKGLFVSKARGRVNDSDEVLNGFCLARGSRGAHRWRGKAMGTGALCSPGFLGGQGVPNRGALAPLSVSALKLLH